MPVAIETVIIVIVVVSFTVVTAVLCALYWLWRLLLEDRRCSRLGNSAFHHQWQSQSSGERRLEDGHQRALLGSRRERNPRITRRQDVFVDERSRRMVKVNRYAESPAARSTPQMARPAPPSSSSATRRTEEILTPEVIVLDGTEPPPPYEAVIK